MQTKDRSGIACDHCGATYRNDFMYYSFDFKFITVSEGHIPSLEMIHNTQVVFSLDICTACFSSISQIIVDNYKKVISTKRRARAPHICELTGVQFTGTYNYYYCVVTKANVRLTGQPNICTKCQKKTHDEAKQCECGNTDYVRPAAIRTDDRFLEFNLSEDAFVEMRKKAEEIRKVAAQWTTNS
jgi:hypothetical protein